jgi:branched-subunit amino acid ABC-type transport system permease component
MDYFLQLVLNGLFVGAFYALVALGYTMVYGIIKLLNFAHGDIYMVGGFVGFTMLTAASGAMGAKGGLLLLIAVMVLAMLTTGTLGLIIERIAYRPLRGAPRLSILITAVGASFSLEYGIALAYGPNPRAYPVGMGTGSFNVFGVRISTGQLIMVVIAVILMIALDTLVRRTRSGRAMRAISQDPRACLAHGRQRRLGHRPDLLPRLGAGRRCWRHGRCLLREDRLPHGLHHRAQGLHCRRHRRHRQHPWRSPGCHRARPPRVLRHRVARESVA